MLALSAPTRKYMPEKTHCPWIFASVKSAEQEYESLKTLNGKVNVSVPFVDRRIQQGGDDNACVCGGCLEPEEGYLSGNQR